MVEHTFEGIQKLSSLCDPHGVNCYQRSQFQAERFLGHLPSTGITRLSISLVELMNYSRGCLVLCRRHRGQRVRLSWERCSAYSACQETAGTA